MVGVGGIGGIGGVGECSVVQCLVVNVYLLMPVSISNHNRMWTCRAFPYGCVHS